MPLRLPAQELNGALLPAQLLKALGLLLFVPTCSVGSIALTMSGKNLIHRVNSSISSSYEEDSSLRLPAQELKGALLLSCEDLTRRRQFRIQANINKSLITEI